MQVSYPKVKKKSNGDFYIEFILNSKRIRLLNGNKAGVNLKPNDFPPKDRKLKANLLAKLVYEYLVSNNYQFTSDEPKDELELFDKLVSQ
jgi:hypothetical protein